MYTCSGECSRALTVQTRQTNAGREQTWDQLRVLWGALSGGGAEVCGWWLRGSEISLRQRLLKDVQLL